MSARKDDISAETAFYRKKFYLSIIVPGTFVFLLWFVKICEVLFETDLSFLGIYPLELKGLTGIIFSPLIHENFKHLISNSIPLLLLGTGLFYFYSDVALKVSGWIYFLTGLFVWIGARDAWHIGASGVVYGLASFLFFSGIIRKYYRLVALSLLVVFLYGSMIWGMVPELYRNVSWESHILGFVAGIIMAIIYRKEGPQNPVVEWMQEDYEEPEIEEEDIEEDKRQKLQDKSPEW
jgi:membrane associated rhomboid family serine protease